MSDLLNPLPKFVASWTLHGRFEWNASVIEGDAMRGETVRMRLLDSTAFDSGVTLLPYAPL